jgi:hypothetical protein
MTHAVGDLGELQKQPDSSSIAEGQRREINYDVSIGRDEPTDLRSCNFHGRAIELADQAGIALGPLWHCCDA